MRTCPYLLQCRVYMYSYLDLSLWAGHVLIEAYERVSHRLAASSWGPDNPSLPVLPSLKFMNEFCCCAWPSVVAPDMASSLDGRYITTLTITFDGFTYQRPFRKNLGSSSEIFSTFRDPPIRVMSVNLQAMQNAHSSK